jgi:hypothetical protein
VIDSSTAPGAISNQHTDEDSEERELSRATSAAGDDDGSVSNEDDASHCDDDDADSFDGQEPFEELRPKIIQLCCEIGLGEPSEVEKMEGSSFHRVVGVSFASGKCRDHILRMPRMAYDEREERETCDQVAIINFFSQLENVPVPKVYAYDATTNNAIEHQYVLQERLPGKTPMNQYYELPMAGKLQIATSVAELIIKLESVKLPQPGRIINDKSIPLTAHTSGLTNTGIDIMGYRESPIRDLKPVKGGDLTDFLTELFDQRQQAQERKGSTYLSEALIRLKEMAQQMKRAGLIRKYDTDNVLYI